MDDLIDTYGEEFVNGLKQTISEKQAEREQVSDRAKIGIADKAINEQAFGSGDPMFQYTDEETGITHDVLLMETPDPESKTFYSMMNELDSGAVTAPLLYLGQFYSSLFNDPDLAKSLEPGNWYIIIGELSQWTDDQDKTHDQVSPVRGVMTNQGAKELADKELEESDINEPEPEPADEVNEPEEMASDPEESPFMSSGDDDEEEDDDFPATQESVDSLVERFAEQHGDVVWELEEGDDNFGDLVEAIVANHEELDRSNDDHLEQTSPMVLDRIGRENEEDDDEGEEESMFGT